MTAQEWVDLARAAAERGDLAEAQWRYSEAARLVPSHPMVWIALGRTGAKLGDYERAKAAFERAISLAEGADLAEAHFGMAFCHNGLRQYRDALAALDGAIEVLREHQHPLLPDALYALGLARYHTGRAEQAAIALEEAATLRPDFIAAWALLERALFRARRFGRLVGVFVACITKSRRAP